jgi:hypothetical protein
MFGSNRRKATAHTIEAVRPLIGIYQRHNGTPQGFWEDEFVLGFFGFMIGFHGSVTSGRNLSQEDKGYVLADVFTAISNLNGHAIAKNFLRLSTLEQKSQDFETGADYASYCAFASIGKMNEQGRPFFEKAKQIAAGQGKEHEHGAVVSALIHLLYIQTLQQRFE